MRQEKQKKRKKGPLMFAILHDQILIRCLQATPFQNQGWSPQRDEHADKRGGRTKILVSYVGFCNCAQLVYLPGQSIQPGPSQPVYIPGQRVQPRPSRVSKSSVAAKLLFMKLFVLVGEIWCCFSSLLSWKGTVKRNLEV